jgi:hypothetical protein
MSNARNICDMKEDQVSKAWVNFQGTGTVVIRKSLNVTSVTDSGTGLYDINFTSAFSDTSYCYTLFGRDPDNTANVVNNAGCAASDAKTTTGVRVRYSYNSAQLDSPEMNFMAFSNET